jgi:hypothetical protein
METVFSLDEFKEIYKSDAMEWSDFSALPVEYQKELLEHWFENGASHAAIRSVWMKTSKAYYQFIDEIGADRNKARHVNLTENNGEDDSNESQENVRPTEEVVIPIVQDKPPKEPVKRTGRGRVTGSRNKPKNKKDVDKISQPTTRSRKIPESKVVAEKELAQGKAQVASGQAVIAFERGDAVEPDIKEYNINVSSEDLSEALEAIRTLIKLQFKGQVNIKIQVSETKDGSTSI